MLLPFQEMLFDRRFLKGGFSMGRYSAGGSIHRRFDSTGKGSPDDPKYLGT